MLDIYPASAIGCSETVKPGAVTDPELSPVLHKYFGNQRAPVLALKFIANQVSCAPSALVGNELLSYKDNKRYAPTYRRECL